MIIIKVIAIKLGIQFSCDEVCLVNAAASVPNLSDAVRNKLLFFPSCSNKHPVYLTFALKALLLSRSINFHQSKLQQKILLPLNVFFSNIVKPLYNPSVWTLKAQFIFSSELRFAVSHPKVTPLKYLFQKIQPITVRKNPSLVCVLWRGDFFFLGTLMGIRQNVCFAVSVRRCGPD